MRGDCGYGNEKFMTELEARALPYMLKLRHTPKVKALVRDVLYQSDGWVDCGEGWEAAEAQIKLSGWSRTRRLVIVRESPAVAPVEAQKRRRRDPFDSSLRDQQGRRLDAPSPAPWSGRIAVLVTSLDERVYPTVCMPKQYRDRGDAEPERSGDSQPQAARRASAARQNNYDELKNQWGWCGLLRAAPRRSPLRFTAGQPYGWLSRCYRFQRYSSTGGGGPPQKPSAAAGSE